MIGLLVLLAAAQVQTDASVPDEIVVVAAKEKCDVRFADKTMSDAEFDRRAKDWAAGVPVRVRAYSDADLKCLTKIAFKLGDRGVRMIEFVTPNGKPMQPLSNAQYATIRPQVIDRKRLDPGLTVQAYRDPTLLGREHSKIAARASDMILEGNCNEARKFALEAGDIDVAASVVTICGNRIGAAAR